MMIAILILAAMASVGGVQAQDAPCEVHGRVVDSRDAGIAGVTLTITPFGGGAPVVVKSGEQGVYQATGLTCGIHRLEFALQGLHTLTHYGVVLLPGKRLELNVTLRPAAASSGVPKSTQSAAALQPGDVLVRLETAHGAIDIAVDTVRAPVTAANFLKYVDGGFYDGGRFHRATRPDNYTPAPPDRPMMEIIQAGINPARRADGFPAIPLERTSVTGLKHVAGMVSMARGTGADTARSDFFILLDDQPSLDFGGKRFEDGQGGAAFGRVVAGMDVVRKIQQQPVKAQALTPPVDILKATRVPRSRLEFRGQQ